MTRFSQILCPIDFSDISQHALDQAAAMASWYDARLTLLHVFVTLPTMDLPPLVLEDSTRARLMAFLKEMAGRVPKEVPLDLRVEQATYVHDEVLAQIAATRADLLVLGTHGRSGFQRLFLGSVTEKVIRKAPCPVLVVPPRAPDVAPGTPVQFRRILCVVDFSASSLDAVACAVNLAEEADARLTLLHVVDIPTVVSDEPATFDVDFDRLRAAASAQARRRLQDLIPEGARTFCTVETVTVDGRAYPEILREATERESDLIVMGAHGRAAVDRLIFGSTTHHVIRAAACPVLVVRSA